MTITFNGTDIETMDSGFLVNIEDWGASLARHLDAAADRKGSARRQGGKIAGQRESRRKGGY